MRGMDQKERNAWLEAKLKETGISASRVAEVLGIHRSQLSRKNPKNGSRRRLSDEDIAKICEAFGWDNPLRRELAAGSALGGIPVVGRLAENLWLQSDAPEQPREEKVGLGRTSGFIRPAYPIEEQVGFLVEVPGLAGENFRVGDYIVAVPFAKYRSTPNPNDLLVIRRRNRGLESLALRRAVRIDGIIELKAVLQKSVTQLEADKEIIGLVIGRHEHFL